jgi:WD40 repeat protein
MKLEVANDRWAFEPPPTRVVECEAPVTACAFDRAGSTVAFALGDGHVRRVPADRAVPLPQPGDPAHGGVVLALVGDPAGDGFVSGGDDGRILRHGGDGAISEITSIRGKWIDGLAGHAKTGMLAAIAGRMAVVIGRDGAVRELGPHESTVSDLVFSPDGGRIATAHYNGVTVWSLADAAQPPRRFAWKGSHLKVGWSPDTKFVVTATQEHDLHVWRLAQQTDMRMQGYPTKVKSLAWSADARWLLTGSQPCFTAWPFAGKGPEGKPPLQFGEEGAGLMMIVAGHPEADYAAGGFDSGELQVGDLRQRRSMVVKLADKSPITCLAWSPDGWRLAAGNEAGQAFVIDLQK